MAPASPPGAGPTVVEAGLTPSPPVAEVAGAVPIATVPPAPVPASAVIATPPAPLVTPAAAVARPQPRRQRVARGEGDSILAKIVAGLTVPAAELEVTGPTQPAAGAGKGRMGRRASDRLATVDPAVGPDDRKGAATRKALADKKAAADKQALADKAAAKEAAEAKRTERAQPARIWVQVAGGANEAGLASAWKIMKGKAPGVLSGKQAYTTPLRATNRVLTGPFKTDAEARAYVNQLARSGVQAFTFTSDPGQKVVKLDAK